jgi:uncharacterized membrane protein
VRRPTAGLAGLFLASGVTHLVRPAVFTPLIPRALPSPTGIVYASGAAELLCAAGLLRGSRWAGPASAGLLVAILPGNVQMALDATARARRRPTPGRIAFAAGCWARLPLQAPLIRAALNSRR